MEQVCWQSLVTSWGALLEQRTGASTKAPHWRSLRTVSHRCDPTLEQGSRDSLTAHAEDHGEAAVSCSPHRTVMWTTQTADSSGNPLLLARLGTRGRVHCNVKHYNLAQKG